MFADAADDDDATTEGPTMPPGKIDVSFCLGVILGSGLPDFGVSVGVCVCACSFRFRRPTWFELDVGYN